MKWILGLGLVCFSAPDPQASQADPRKFPVDLSGKHYRMLSTGTKEQAQELLDFMEIVFSTYAALLKPTENVEQYKMIVILYKDRKDYLAAGSPPGSGAYYSLTTKRLVGYHDDLTMRNFFAHEGMHQFTDVTCKNMFELPFWFIEGVADCIGNSVVKDKKLYMCVKSGVIARMRLPVIQEAVRERKSIPWRKFFTLTQPEFMADAKLCYSQAWSICHFLISYPNFEDRTRQIPDGTYRKNYATYYELLRRGETTHSKAWEEAFKGIAVDKLEEKWQEYVLKMDSGKYLGFMGKEIDDADAEKLGLAEKFGGVKVETVVKDGVGEKCGLLAGDIIVKFGGKPLLRDMALERLKIFMQDVVVGKPAKLGVLRDKAEIELSPVWEK